MVNTHGLTHWKTTTSKWSSVNVGLGMTARKQGTVYDKWHRRVEGQIRHVIGQHPEWFTFTSKNDCKSQNAQFWCINALAKRIVGEIVADLKLATVSNPVVSNCLDLMGKDDDCRLSSSERQDASWCPALGNPESNKDRCVAQPGSASALGAEGRWFKSSHTDQPSRDPS